MIDLKQKVILQGAINIYGIHKQSIVAIEEMSELTKEITKSLREEMRSEHMVEEIADVLIMVEQVKMMYEVSDDEIQRNIDYKINRLNDRLIERIIYE